MTHAIDDVLHESFVDVRASLARQKSRVLVASGPRSAVEADWQPGRRIRLHSGASLKLFRAAGRVLRADGQLWTVFNSHLPYRAHLTAAIEPTRIIGQNAKFTVTVSTSSAQGRSQHSWSARR